MNLGCFGHERKKKRKRETGGSGDQNGLLPILSLLLRHRKSIATGFPGPCVMTGLSVSLHGAATKITNAHDRVVLPCATNGLCCDKIPIVFCHDRDFFVATGFLKSSILIEISLLQQRMTGLVSRQGLGVRVAEVCGDRAFGARDRAPRVRDKEPGTRDREPRACDKAHNSR